MKFVAGLFEADVLQYMMYAGAKEDLVLSDGYRCLHLIYIFATCTSV